MRIVVCLVTVAAVLHRAYPEAADAVRSGGHNPPTRKLEIAFKVAGGVRAGSKDGCYAPPRRMAALIRFWGPLPAEVARWFGPVRVPRVVYVIGSRSSCQRMIFALRDRGKLFILDTAAGEVLPARGAARPPGRRGRPPGARSPQASNPEATGRSGCASRTVPRG